MFLHKKQLKSDRKMATRCHRYFVMLCALLGGWCSAVVAQAAVTNGVSGTVMFDNSSMKQVGSTLDEILKAVNPDNNNESRVSNRVKEIERASGLNWVKLFNTGDTNDQLPFADAFLGGYIRHFFDIFLDKQMDGKVREMDYAGLVKMQDDLVAGDNQFNMNASGAAVSLAVDDSYSAIKKLPARKIQTADSMKGIQPINLLTSQMIKGQNVSDSPNGRDLIGPNRYDDQQKQRAAMFVRSILGGVEVMSDITVRYSGNVLEVYVPNSTSGGQWFTFSNIKEAEYKKFLSALDNLKLYQEFKIKQLASNALRSLYTANMVAVYGDRMPQVKVKHYDIDGKEDGSEELKSIVELEDEVAKLGIDKEYLENIKNGTVADFQLEMLATLNRIVYFLNKIHRDGERTSLAMSAAAVKLAAPDNATDSSYYSPIGNWVKSRCWNDSERSECKNPGATTTGGLDNVVGE